MPRQLTLVDVPSRRCSLCGRPYGRPNPSCARCQLRRDPLPPATPDPAADARGAIAPVAAAARLARLRLLGRHVRVGLVGCSATKRPGTHPARELYIGAFFRRALPIAEKTCDEAWILSARYGLVALDHELPAYNEVLSGRQKDRGWWGGSVLTSLANAYEDLPVHLVFFAGAPYVEGVTGVDPRTGRWTSFNAMTLERNGWTYETPLRGLDRADRFRWFDTNRNRASPPNLKEGGDAAPDGDPP